MVDAFDPVSSVVLREDVIKKFREFFPTLAEYKGQDRIQIIEGAVAASGAATLIYTVPENNTLWITSAMISGGSDGGAAGGTVGIYASPPDKIFISVYIKGNMGHSNQSLSFPMPIKVEGGSSLYIEATGSASNDAIGIIHGWIEPKKVI